MKYFRNRIQAILKLSLKGQLLFKTFSPKIPPKVSKTFATVLVEFSKSLLHRFYQFISTVEAVLYIPEFTQERVGLTHPRLSNARKLKIKDLHFLVILRTYLLYLSDIYFYFLR